MFLKKRKEERRRREAEAAAAARWMGAFAHPQVEVDPDARSTPECKVVRIVGDEGAAAFVPAFLEPHNSTGVRELHVLGDNPLRGITAALSPAGLQLIGSAAATLPTLVLFKISGLFLLLLVLLLLLHLLFLNQSRSHAHVCTQT